MGLFSKKPEQRRELHVLVQGLDIKHDVAAETWEIEYKGESFFSDGTRFSVPSLQELDQCLAIIAKLEGEMRRCIEERFKDFKPSEDRQRMLRDLSFIISIDELMSDQRFEVTWSGDKHWGDMQVDFVIEDEKIVDEVWGD